MTCLQLRRNSILPLSVWLTFMLLFHVKIIITIHAFKDENDFQAAIREVFGTPPTLSSGTTQSSYDKCVCVPFTLCNDEDIFGTSLKENRDSCDSYSEVCCYNMKNPTKTSDVSENDRKMNCGRSHNKMFRVIGVDLDNEAQYGDVPWMVAILRSNSKSANHTFVCGASLIHLKVVLTANHCVHNIDPNELVIRAGDWDLKTQDELLTHQERRVSKIIKHNKYNGGTLINDIALIILTRSFTLDINVGTICLPPQDYEFTGERCYANGWGKDAFGETGNYQDILKKIDLSVIPFNRCLNQLRHTRLGPKFKLHDSFICAGGEIGKDTCKGDGGSPLTCPTIGDPDRQQQAGIVAWGIGCGDSTPGVYVNVALFRDWIDQQMDDHGLDTSHYDT